jgi:hypothetical protein
MALGELASLIEYLTEPNPGGLSNRKQFNEAPESRLGRLAPTELQAFVTFDKEAISIEVLRHVIHSGSHKDDVEAFGKWLAKYLAWEWPLAVL